MSWKDLFADDKWGNAFGVKGPLYDPTVGHRGTDLRAPAGGELIAWERMTCIENGYSSVVGPYSNFRLDDGMFLGVAHLREGTRPDVGAVLERGVGRIALAAGPGDRHGSAWTGPHFHIVLSKDARAATGYGPLFDARPRILAALNDAPTPAPASNEVTEWVRASSEPGAPFWPKGPLMARIQRGLSAMGRYNNPDGSPRPDDGDPASFTAKGIQITLNVSRCNGVKPFVQSIVDGLLGKNNAWGVQWYGKGRGDYRGPMDGDPREGSWTAFALGLERP